MQRKKSSSGQPGFILLRGLFILLLLVLVLAVLRFFSGCQLQPVFPYRGTVLFFPNG